MTRFTPFPLLIALMQTATTLPVFLVGFPAGSLADIVNRRLLVRVGAILAQSPGLPVALVFGILVVVLFGLDKHGVGIVGAIPRGLPLPSWPAIGFEEYLGSSPGTRHRACTHAEHISAAQKFAARHHYDLDANQELIALGVSNLGAGLFGGFVGGGSLSKTTVNDVAGAHAGVGKEMIRTTDPRPRAILLDLEASSGLDISSADMLAELVAELKVQGIELLLATLRVHWNYPNLSSR